MLVGKSTERILTLIIFDIFNFSIVSSNYYFSSLFSSSILGEIDMSCLLTLILFIILPVGFSPQIEYIILIKLYLKLLNLLYFIFKVLKFLLNLEWADVSRMWLVTLKLKL